MSPEIELEICFLFHSFLMGILITVLYDVLRIVRRIIPHNIVAVSLEDFLYWIFCSILVFLMLIRKITGYCVGLPWLVRLWACCCIKRRWAFCSSNISHYFYEKYCILWENW